MSEAVHALRGTSWRAFERAYESLTKKGMPIEMIAMRLARGARMSAAPNHARMASPPLRSVMATSNVGPRIKA